MHLIWALCISIGVLCLALLIRYLGISVVEEESTFSRLVIAFLVVYVGAAFILGRLIPSPAPLGENMATTEETLSSL